MKAFFDNFATQDFPQDSQNYDTQGIMKVFIVDSEDSACSKTYFCFNSHTGGMAVELPYGFEINFVRNLISGSAS